MKDQWDNRDFALQWDQSDLRLNRALVAGIKKGVAL